MHDLPLDSHGRSGTPLAGAGAGAEDEHPVWSRRYITAVDRYSMIGPLSPELIAAAIDGLHGWASILPQFPTNQRGGYVAANAWGLEPEQTVTLHLAAQLQVARPDLAVLLKEHYNRLDVTAGDLDGCFPMTTPFEVAAADRLTREARKQAWMLGDLMAKYSREVFSGRTAVNTVRAPQPMVRSEILVAPSVATYPHQAAEARKRAERATGIEAIRHQLVEHIRAARDHAWFLKDRGKTPELLPRPTQNALGKMAGLDKSAVSRCINDSRATDLRTLWQIAGDLELVMKYGRR